MMGPYVIRSINAHIHTWENDLHDSLTEDFGQEEPQGIELPTCECGDPVAEGCGICLSADSCPTRCSRTERTWAHDCTPPGCEVWLAFKGGTLPPLPGRGGCVDDPTCCYDVEVGCGPSGGCVEGEMHIQTHCGGGPGDHIVADFCVLDPDCLLCIGELPFNTIYCVLGAPFMATTYQVVPTGWCGVCRGYCEAQCIPGFISTHGCAAGCNLGPCGNLQCYDSCAPLVPE